MTIVLACAVGGLIAIVAFLLGRGQRDRSGLGEEDVASILGYEPPHWPLNGHKSRHDDESTPAP